jgi:hypothetical protein
VFLHEFVQTLESKKTKLFLSISSLRRYSYVLPLAVAETVSSRTTRPQGSVAASIPRAFLTRPARTLGGVFAHIPWNPRRLRRLLLQDNNPGYVTLFRCERGKASQGSSSTTPTRRSPSTSTCASRTPTRTWGEWVDDNRHGSTTTATRNQRRQVSWCHIAVHDVQAYHNVRSDPHRRVRQGRNKDRRGVREDPALPASTSSS